MKKLKALSTAVTIGLAALSFATARADELAWTGRVDRNWSTPGNWGNTLDGSRVETIPTKDFQVYIGYPSWNFNHDIVLDQDVEVAGWMVYSDREPHRRFSGGHTLIVSGVSQDNGAPFCGVGVQVVSDANTRILLNGVGYIFGNGKSLGTTLLVTNKSQVIAAYAPTFYANVTNSVVDGAYLEYAGLNLNGDKTRSTKGNEFNIVNDSVLKIKGKCQLGNSSYTKTDMYIKGTKPAGGLCRSHLVS